VHNRAGDTTYCPDCHGVLIERDWYEIRRYRLTPEARCPDCGRAIAGRFAADAEDFGRQRIPVSIPTSKGGPS